jgi:uncharacterized membrane protein
MRFRHNLLVLILAANIVGVWYSYKIGRYRTAIFDAFVAGAILVDLLKGTEETNG